MDNSKEIYTISEFAEIVGVTIQTLRNWDKSGKLKPAQLTEGGNRLYSYKQVLQFKGKAGDTSNKAAIYYIASKGNENATEELVNRMVKHLDIKGKEYEIYKEKEGDTSELKNLIKEVGVGTYDEIIVNDENLGLSVKELKVIKSIINALQCELILL